jgi:subfamily B ATP-binding cassette protein MsbA
LSEQDPSPARPGQKIQNHDDPLGEQLNLHRSASWPLVKRLLKDYVYTQRWRIGAALLCMVLVAISTAAFTQIMKPIIDDIFVSKREEMLLPIAMAALIVFLVKGCATYGQAVLMSFVGNRIVADVQSQLFRRIVAADLAFFSGAPAGKLISRFLNDIMLLRLAVSNTLVGLGKDSLTTLALVAVMFYEDWQLALVAFFAFPTAIFPIRRIGRRMRKVSDHRQTHVGRLTNLLDETFQGIRHVKAYSMEAYESGRADAAIDEVFRLNFKSERVRNLLHPIMEFLAGLAIVAVILYGGHQVIVGAKLPGSFFAFITALLLAYEPIKRLARLNTNLQEGLAAAQRVYHLMDREPEIQDAPDARPLAFSSGEIRFDNVEFAYREDIPALDGVDLIAPAGKTIALVGPSGSGKSTVLNLIPRFYDVGNGTIRVDGQDVRQVTLSSLRERIALVSQEILLFDDSVRANIGYGRPDASEAEILAAAKAASAHEFILGLEKGYDTRVGPRGSSLSGGQRQRVAIARAILKDAPILLLDEATSALDTDSERQVQAALEKLMKGRTTIVIAHRLSTVTKADIIYVLEAGRIVESGSHDALLARGGAYARLYDLQFSSKTESAAQAPTPAVNLSEKDSQDSATPAIAAEGGPQGRKA